MTTSGRFRARAFTFRASNCRQIKDDRFPIEGSITYHVWRDNYGLIRSLTFRKSTLKRSSVRDQSAINNRRSRRFVISIVCVTCFSIVSAFLSQRVGVNLDWDFRFFVYFDYRCPVVWNRLIIARSCRFHRGQNFFDFLLFTFTLVNNFPITFIMYFRSTNRRFITCGIFFIRLSRDSTFRSFRSKCNVRRAKAL